MSSLQTFTRTYNETSRGVHEEMAMLAPHLSKWNVDSLHIMSCFSTFNTLRH